MQYDKNAEKYGYEGEMTPIECDELQSYRMSDDHEKLMPLREILNERKMNKWE